MRRYNHQKQQTNTNAAANQITQKKHANGSLLQFTVDTPESIVQGRLQNVANNSTIAHQTAQLQAIANDYPIQQTSSENAVLQGVFAADVTDVNHGAACQYVNDNHYRILQAFKGEYKRGLGPKEETTLLRILNKPKDLDLPLVSAADTNTLIKHLNTMEAVMDKDGLLTEVRNLLDGVPKAEWEQGPPEDHEFQEEIKAANLDNEREFTLSIAQKWLDDNGRPYDIVTVKHGDQTENWNIKNDEEDAMANVEMTDKKNEFGLPENDRGKEELLEYNDMACCVLQAMPYLYGEDEATSLLYSKQLFLLIRLERMFPGLFPNLNGLAEFTEDHIVGTVYSMFNIEPQETNQLTIQNLYKDVGLRGKRYYVGVPGHALPIEVKSDEVVPKIFKANPYTKWLTDRGGSTASLRKANGGSWGAMLKSVTGQDTIGSENDRARLASRLQAQVIAGRRR